MTTQAKPYLLTEAQVLRECLEVIRGWGLRDHIRRQNVGGCHSSDGRYVAFGRPGDADLGGVFPEWFGVAAGKRIVIECKREGFRPPPKPKSGHPETSRRLHWQMQLGELIKVNRAGGYGLWCDDHTYLWRALHLISKGYYVIISDVTEEPEFYTPRKD